MKTIAYILVSLLLSVLVSSSIAVAEELPDDNQSEAADAKKTGSSRRALARTFLSKSGFEEQSRPIVNRVVKDMMSVGIAATKSSTMPDKAKKRDALILQALRRVFLHDVDMISVLESVFVDLIARDFSENELRELIKFYDSDTGRKLVKMTPELTKEGRFLGRTVLGPKIDRALNAALQEECELQLFKGQ